jgi:HAD superfamily hydrolase (TIGR01484 family)
MRPIKELDRDAARGLAGILFDLDDTLLDSGQLTERAYSSLHRLHEAGLVLLAVTGRPSGWGEVLALQWPVAGFVTENGAVAILKMNGKPQVIEEVDLSERAVRRDRLMTLVGLMKAEFPALTAATDVSMRRSDFTFDIGEYNQVPTETVGAAMRFARAHGALTVRSSVHLHVTYDGSDKASGVVRLLHQHFGFDVTEARRVFAFIGDSENDESCLAGFKYSFAVANLRGRPTVSPQYVTEGERGRGFAEFADHLLRLRR